MVRFLAMVLLVIAIALAVVAAGGSSSNSDAESLLGFMKGIDKDPLGSLSKSWLRESIDSSGCPSSWSGVFCDSRGRVSGLDLGGLALSGQIMPGTLGSISSLTYLSLRNNFFSGRIPADLVRLSLLEHLDLSNNLLTGGIASDTLVGMSSLRNLSLANNKLSGPIPAPALPSAAALTLLDLSNNVFSGGIPPSIVSCDKLISLDLSGNQLNGTLPTHLNSLDRLQRLDLHKNQLSGPIPPSWMLLSSIQTLDLSMNLLSGPLPWLETLLPPDLLYVNMSFNQLSGYLAPEDAANLFANKIQILDLSNNQLAGSLPSFEFVFSLRVLKLNANQFTGFVPPALLSAEASLLEELDLSANRLSGNVWSISAARLNVLNLSSNGLSGGLPPRLGTCALVDLSNNAFSGNLSVMTTWGNSLESINLNNNSLTGSLPNRTAQLLRLISLDVGHNKLTGDIPPGFGSFPKLTSLDMSVNDLTGPLPDSFFFSTTLASLRLSQNRLRGTIPLEDAHDQDTSQVAIAATTLSPLRLLDLADNQLSGSIPDRLLSGFPTLEVVNLSGNKLSGTISDRIAKLARLQQLDLSSNQLSGTIPATLPSSLVALNLTNNNLSGSIPTQLERRFPPSSFYPGNRELQSDGFPTWSGSPQAGQPGEIIGSRNKQGGGGKQVSPGFKAGLIGGCIAAFLVVLLAVGAVVYYKRSSSSSVAATKAVEQIDTGSSKSKVPVFRIVEKDFVHHPATNANNSAAAASPADATGFAENESLKRSPSSKGKSKFFSSLRTEPAATASMSLESSKAGMNSPDKLAGDLFLLDSDVVFTAEELSRAPAEVLGRSSHGTSYKATIDTGHIITVKWLKEGLAKNKREFTAEAKRFGSIRHDNVLPLRGYYWGPREHEKLILTDYMAYGSLADRLAGAERSGRRYPPLTWLQRLRVSADVARGICYLHSEHKMPHGNLKASNVLFDAPELHGRLTDYGLHRLMTAAGTASQFVNAGALGYRAPELSNVKRPKPSTRADVYAYGVILLEIITGKAADDIISANSGAVAVDLPDWVRLLASESRTSECFDPHLTEGRTENNSAIQVLLDVAFKCISEEASNRPPMRSVYEDVFAIYTSTQQERPSSS